MTTESKLGALGHASEETEFFTPIPPGYEKGKTKYVVVFGTVMSGLGKGIFSSSLAKIVKDKGLTVAPIKLEGYLNRDSGTLNPYRHGEVFVLDDGMECDMDLGTYERMLNQDLSHLNFATSGQIFSDVLEKEREGLYLGRDVQMIPHVTGEVKLRLRNLAMASRADVVFVEIGGTAGDVENAYFIEAVREMSFEEGPGQFCFVALTYVVEPKILGEQKSKPAQINLKLLNAAGIHPHIIACRATVPVTKKVREKIAMFASVPMDRVFSMHDCDSVYVVPEMLRGAGIDAAVMDILELESRDEEAEERSRKAWSDYIARLRGRKHTLAVGIIGKYTSVRDSYASIIQALEHAGATLGGKVRLEWVDSAELTSSNVAERLEGINGVIVPGGFGVRGADGKIECIRYAREHRLPYLGLCYGMQLAVIEYARHVCGLTHANSTEIEPDCPHPIIDLLPEQKKIEGLGGNMRLGGCDIAVSPGTELAAMYDGAERIRLRFRHRYEVNPDYVERLEQAGLVFSGASPNHPIMQVVELPQSIHPFFMATQAHPELTSRPRHPDPMFVGLVRAAMRHSGVDPETSNGPIEPGAASGHPRGPATASA